MSDYVQYIDLRQPGNGAPGLDRHERWREIGQKLNADYFITGSVSMLENNFIMTARLYSVTTGKVVPGSAKTVSCSRAAELYPQARILAKSLIYQIESRQPRV